MSGPMSLNVSPMFRIPLELREEILSHVLLPQLVHTSSPTSDTYSTHRLRRPEPTYVDTRIYLPSRMPSNLFLVCKQLREECLTYHARRLNSNRLTNIPDSNPIHHTTNYQPGEGDDTISDESLERLHDDDCARVTLEVLRQHRGLWGYYVPERQEPSPHFMALIPLLSRLKHIKFIVWAGHDWWSGDSTRPIVKIKRLQRARLSRVSADQDDKVIQPTLWENDGTTKALAPRPNPLSVAIDALLRYLPLVEEVKIDLLIHHVDWWSWDLPDPWWEGIREWLDGPISPIAKDRAWKVERRLTIVLHGDLRNSGTVLYQRESVQRDSSVIRIERGTRKVSRFGVPR